MLLTACDQLAPGNGCELSRAVVGTLSYLYRKLNTMIIPTRLKKIAQIADCGSSRYTMDHVHLRQRDNKTELTATNGKSLLRFIVPDDNSTIPDCQTQVERRDFKRIIGASGTISHRIPETPNGVVKFNSHNRDGSPGETVETLTDSAGRYPDADTVLNTPRPNVTTHRVNAKLLRDLLDAVVTSGAEVIDLVTGSDRDPIYIDGTCEGKHDIHTVEFHGILMTCSKD
jgi:hypothetical protein